MLFNMSPGPLIGTLLSVRAPLEPIKERVRMLEFKSQASQAHTSSTNTEDSQAQAIHLTVDVGFYALAA
jgi:hypothetical protein